MGPEMHARVMGIMIGTLLGAVLAMLIGFKGAGWTTATSTQANGYLGAFMRFNGYDALVIYANHTKISAEQEKALLEYVESGKGFIPVHCASYCFLNAPKYIEMVEAGETILICKRNVPIAEVRPIAKKVKRVPQLGWAGDSVKILPSFHEPMSPAELRLWEEGHKRDPLKRYAPGRKTRRK